MRKLVQNTGNVTSAIQKIVQPYIFIGGVSAIVRIADPCRNHRDISQRRGKGVNGTAAARQRRNPVSAAIDRFRIPLRKQDKWILCRGFIGPHRAQLGYVHIRETFAIQMCPQLRENVVRILIRYQAEVNLGCCPRWDHGLQPLALMSGGQLERGYHWAYEEFYRWRSIARGASAHSNVIARVRHFAYAAGWKKFEPLWDAIIRARRAGVMRPVLEGVLSEFGRRAPGSAGRARPAGRDAGRDAGVIQLRPAAAATRPVPAPPPPVP